ncbi:P-loop containing nucleoside triphosphate hydrolase protein [Massariosphaeria phaeospora]|uniref:P-loop containing nucleoside triphosphate hydrolase protein n=1 Tax=Massariosphaeria phaeospora TaxID=100035 RepID=A0A7C8I719_9PLEO|nr:P-loop containing nucleoside triphosphate hydrolase protein [Massariosphaeria phaeospora]
MAVLETGIRRVLDTLLPKIRSRRQSTSHPIILGITGLQGSGKSTWASKIVSMLTLEHGLRAITVSLDDLYKTHDGLIAQRDMDPANKLYRTRGQPGTHDEELAGAFFNELKEYKGQGELKIPSFDKSKFNGGGDRAPKSEWTSITSTPDVVVFEGWCVGFRPLDDPGVEAKHRAAKAGKLLINTPAEHRLDQLLEVNRSLERYCETFMGPQHFDFLIHIDTDDLRNVYTWRVEQEHKLIETKGTGMKDEEVKAFIDGYMPAYELYLEKLREGFFGDQHGNQIRVVLASDRSVENVEEL